MTTAGKNERLSDWAACSCGIALCPRYGTPRRGWAAGTRRATARVGAGGVKIVGEFGEGRERRKVIEKVEIGVVEPSTEWACHPPEPFIVVYFGKEVGKDHSQAGPEDDYGHPGNVSCKDEVDEHAEGESNVRVEGGGELPGEMAEDDALPKTDEDTMDAQTVVFRCGVNKKT